MTKVKLKDAIKDLTTDAAKVRDDASRVRQSADGLAKSLRALENGFIKSLNAKAEQEKRAEEEKRLSDHSKAYVMLDVDEQAAVNAARQEAEKAEKAERAEKQEAKSAPKQEAKAEAPKSEQKPAPKAETKPAVKAEALKSEQKPAPKVETKPEAKAEAPKSEQKPAPKAEAKPEVKAEAPKSEQKPAPKVETKPEAKAEAPKSEQKPETKAEPKPEAPKKPAIGQIISRPGQALPPKPVGLAPNVIRPPRPQQPRPQGQQGAQGNRPQQGQPRPGGNGAFIARPQQGQPRPGGNGAFVARPQQGQQNRPGNGSFQPRPGGNGAFVARPQGARPQGGAGFQARPQGGTGRPAGGGMNRPKPAVPDMAPAMGKERVSNYDPNKKNYVRQHDPEHVARNRKQLSRDAGYSGYDDDVVRGGKRSRMKKPSAQQMMAPIKIEHAYMSGDTIVVRDLCEKIGKTSAEIIKKLFLLGNMATINSEIDFDTASLVCADFDITLEKKPEVTAEDQLTAENFDDSEENLQPRPPVVTIMGHVDHGKTSLLDYIRNAHVASGEAGGITQHIGAYQVQIKGKPITFLDTPGHEAFTSMRARGAMITDIAILVVAAEDGIKPQTIESINHAKAAEIPIIVAINKMDKPDANPERIKQQLTEYGLVAEDWGGDTIVCPISAKTGMGIDNLLEMVALTAEVAELKANPNRAASGAVVEARLDKGRGPIATLLVQNGTLHQGDIIIAGTAVGRVRAMMSDKGQKLTTAGPSVPVEITGLGEVPEAGAHFNAVADERLARELVEQRKEEEKRKANAPITKVSLEDLFSQIQAGEMKNLNIIVKADVMGSVEAVKASLEKISNDEVRVRVIHGAVGAINESDVMLAATSNAIIVGFNVRPDAAARDSAARNHVDMRMYRVIYDAIDEIEAAMKGMLAPKFREAIIGHAEIRQTYKVSSVGTVAGCYVTDGKIQRACDVRIVRDGIVVHEGHLASLQRFKDSVKEVAQGYECGLSFEKYNDIKVGDIVEAYVMEQIEQ